MKFANFSWPWVLAGIAALAGVLFVLQLLRTRYREITVVSTLMWRRALQDAPVRKFRDRFRNPLAYLLILAICSLMWLAMAEPQSTRATETFHILILDGSAGAAAGNRFETGIAALKEAAAALPDNQRQVLWSGASVRTLLARGEDVSLLERRLRGLKPEAAPSHIEALLRQLSVLRQGSQTCEVTLFGDAPVSESLLGSLPKGFSVKRVQAMEKMAHNAGITALGVSDAQSGRWDAVDVYLEAQRSDGLPIHSSDLRIDMDGKLVTHTPEQQANGWLLRDVPAQGGRLTVKLVQGDALALDDTAGVLLPSKSFIRVRVSSVLDAVVRRVLEADPAVRIVDGDADVVIRRAGENLDVSLPALEFVPAARQPQAFLLTYPSALNGEARFADSVDAIGLQQIDAMALAEAAQRPIEVSMREGPRWTLSVWEELLGEDFNFTRSRAFPMFIANSLRWLARTSTTYSYVAAGQPLVGDSIENTPPVVNAAQRTIDPLNVPFEPEQAGELSLRSGARPLSVSLLDPATTMDRSDDGVDLRRGAADRGGSANRWVPLLLMLTLLLLAGEWYGYRTGRVP